MFPFPCSFLTTQCLPIARTLATDFQNLTSLSLGFLKDLLERIPFLDSSGLRELYSLYYWVRG